VGNLILVLLEIYCSLQQRKNFANRPRTDKVIAVVRVAPFFLTHGVVKIAASSSTVDIVVKMMAGGHILVVCAVCWCHVGNKMSVYSTAHVGVCHTA